MPNRRKRIPASSANVYDEPQQARSGGLAIALEGRQGDARGLEHGLELLHLRAERTLALVCGAFLTVFRCSTALWYTVIA